MMNLSSNNFTRLFYNTSTSSLLNSRLDISYLNDTVLETFGFDKGKYAVELYNTGTEAVEVAIRRALKYKRITHGGSNVAKFDESYHGHSLFVEHNVRGFYPKVNHQYGQLECWPKVDVLLLELNPWVHGFRKRNQDKWLKFGMNGLKQITENAVIVADEISTGLYKTGPLFSKKYNTDARDADIILVGKGIGGDYPVIAMIGKKEILYPEGEFFHNYVHNTYGFSSKAIESVCNTITILQSKSDIDLNVKTVENTIKERLNQTNLKYEVRGVMLAIDLGSVYDPYEIQERLWSNQFHVNVYPTDSLLRFQWRLDSTIEQVLNEVDYILEAFYANS